jgi:hypothetical protein
MNTNTQTFDRNDYAETIHPVRLASTIRTARLDFLGPIALVCALGGVARMIQAFLTN